MVIIVHRLCVFVLCMYLCVLYNTLCDLAHKLNYIHAKSINDMYVHVQ